MESVMRLESLRLHVRPCEPDFMRLQEYYESSKVCFEPTRSSCPPPPFEELTTTSELSLGAGDFEVDGGVGSL
jgi:hypothetical protein